MTTFHIGTMGYGYKDWLGVFYPEKTKPENYLSLYSGIFDTVEMDTTFYATPRRDIVQRWRDQTPDGFTFCPKTPRTITHDNSLDNGLGMMAEFVDVMGGLGDKFGPILIQFPPEYDATHAGELHRFLGKLPPVARYAVEFRNRSWDVPETYELLRKHNVCAVSPEYIIMPPRLHRTTDFLYIRFLGRHGAFEQKNRIQKDVIPLLEKWKEWLDKEISRVEAVYAFFNDDFSGHSPATANTFKGMLGLPITEPEIPKQPTLF